MLGCQEKIFFIGVEVVGKLLEPLKKSRMALYMVLLHLVLGRQEDCSSDPVQRTPSPRSLMEPILNHIVPSMSLFYTLLC